MANRTTVSAAIALLSCALANLAPAFGQDPFAVDPAHHNTTKLNSRAIRFACYESTLRRVRCPSCSPSVLDWDKECATPTSKPSEVIVVELKTGDCERRKKTVGSLNEMLSLPAR
jgi:hypothetical protein